MMLENTMSKTVILDKRWLKDNSSLYISGELKDRVLEVKK